MYRVLAPLWLNLPLPDQAWTPFVDSGSAVVKINSPTSNLLNDQFVKTQFAEWPILPVIEKPSYPSTPKVLFVPLTAFLHPPCLCICMARWLWRTVLNSIPSVYLAVLDRDKGRSADGTDFFKKLNNSDGFAANRYSVV